MIDKSHDLPVVRQAQLLELSRSSVYYQAQPTHRGRSSVDAAYR